MDEYKFLKLTNCDGGKPMWIPATVRALYEYQDPTAPTSFYGGGAVREKPYTVVVTDNGQYAVSEPPEDILSLLTKFGDVVEVFQE